MSRTACDGFPWSNDSTEFWTATERLVNRKATDAGEAEWKESSGRLGPVGDVSVEYSDGHDADYDGQVGNGEHHVDCRRYLHTHRI